MEDRHLPLVTISSQMAKGITTASQYPEKKERMALESYVVGVAMIQVEHRNSNQDVRVKGKDTDPVSIRCSSSQ